MSPVIAVLEAAERFALPGAVVFLIVGVLIAGLADAIRRRRS